MADSVGASETNGSLSFTKILPPPRTRAEAPAFLIGNYGNFPKPHVRDFSKFLIAFTQCFPGFRAKSFGNFLLSQPVLGIFASSGR
ncbi:MAG: hypothetical protein KDB03_19615, partial [Planctomycetales bacterium]|nr:hypothetical protein [Planctomycetales bacterium]